MSWRLANSLIELSAEVHALSPKQTIYAIGDSAHQASASDHNPNAAGVVCAIDIMQGNGLDLQAIANHLVAHPHPDAKYVIHNRKIASKSQGWRWRTYTGSDPHTNHIHVSVGVGSDGRSVQPYDDKVSWGLGASPAPTPAPAPSPSPTPAPSNDNFTEALVQKLPTIQQGDKGHYVSILEGLLIGHGYPTSGNAATVDGNFGPTVRASVIKLQQARNIPADGVVGPRTWAALLDV